MLPAPVCRFRAPPGGGPLKGPAERKFEGIKLENGPNVPQGPVTSLSICESCFRDEEMRQAGGSKTRLPAGVLTSDLACEKIEPLAHMKDPDPDIENEFFVTRQVCINPSVGVLPMPL